MKQKFKVRKSGDKTMPTKERMKVRITKDTNFWHKKGEVHEVGKYVTKGYYGADAKTRNEYHYEVEVGGYGISVNNCEIISPTLTIKKLTRTREGDEYFTWQFSVNNRVSNHNFNSPQSRDKSLKNFIKYIQENDFEIVNK